MKYATAFATVLSLAACSDSNRGSFEGASPELPGSGFPDDPNCVEAFAETRRAVDIIVSIDQSASMTDEVASLNENINLLPSLLAESGLDYRVVMVAEVGNGKFDVCVPPPLGLDCGSNGNIFRSIDQHIESTDTLVLLLKTFDYPVPKLAWRDFLRPGVLKVFVPITDDDSRELPANTFSLELQRKGEPLFGTVDAPNYAFYPVIGMNDYPEITPCATADAAGLEYQRLAARTKGKWFSVCRPSLREVIETIGKSVGEAVACEVAIPPPPSGTTLDLTKINVRVSHGDGAPTIVPQDQGRACEGGADGWQFSADKKKIILCGGACGGVRSEPATKFSVGFGCNTVIR